MKASERRLELQKKARTQAFLQKFQNKRTVIPAGGITQFLGSPGHHEVDKRDGILALHRENQDVVSPWVGEGGRKQDLYELRDKIDHLALYNYFKENDVRSEIATDIRSPEEVRGPFRRKFYSSEDFDARTQLKRAE